jgi:hypothetical protein
MMNWSKEPQVYNNPLNEPQLNNKIMSKMNLCIRVLLQYPNLS